MVEALILTLIIETVCAILYKQRKFLFYIVLLIINTITNLTINFVCSKFMLVLSFTDYNLLILVLEFLVVVVEGITYYKYLHDKKGIEIALVSNIVSFIVGTLILSLIQQYFFY